MLDLITTPNDPFSRIGGILVDAKKAYSVDLSALDLIAEIGEVRCLNTLHAKSIVTDVKAYVGSLNFTKQRSS